MADSPSLRESHALPMEPRARAAAQNRSGRHRANGMCRFERRASTCRDDGRRISSRLIAAAFMRSPDQYLSKARIPAMCSRSMF